MRISELLRKLQRMYAEEGDVVVEVRNEEGIFKEVVIIEKVNISRKRSVIVWKIFIDA